MHNGMYSIEVHHAHDVVSIHSHTYVCTLHIDIGSSVRKLTVQILGEIFKHGARLTGLHVDDHLFELVLLVHVF